MVEAADKVFAGDEIDAGLAADGGVDLGQERCWNLNVADAAHVDGGEEAGDVAEDAATEGEEERVAVSARGGELLGEGFDAAHALVRFAAGQEENVWRFFERVQEGLRPESPDIGRGNDEGAKRLVSIQLFETRIEGAEEIGADGY